MQVYRHEQEHIFNEAISRLAGGVLHTLLELIIKFPFDKSATISATLSPGPTSTFFTPEIPETRTHFDVDSL